MVYCNELVIRERLNVQLKTEFGLGTRALLSFFTAKPWRQITGCRQGRLRYTMASYCAKNSPRSEVVSC